MKRKRRVTPAIFYKTIAVADFELGLPVGEARTLAALCLFYPNIRPSRALLAAKTRFHIDTVTDYLKGLEKAGHIKVERPYHQRSHYTIAA